MKTLLFKGFPHTDSYQGEHVPNRVKAGGQCQVSEAGAAYLLATFGSAFEDVTPKPEAPKPSDKPQKVEK
jgi:hypothetical protein